MYLTKKQFWPMLVTGVVMGVVLLNEKAHFPKWLGTGLLVTGLVWISL